MTTTATLAVTTRVGKTDLTIQRLNQLIIEHRANIKPQAMLRLVREFSLTELQADKLLEARADWSASPFKIAELMRRGFSPEQVHALYDARERINSAAGIEGSITIAKLIKVNEAFGGAGCEANCLTEIVLAICDSALKDKPEISLAEAVNRACDISNRSGAAMLETVLELVRNYGGQGGGWQE